MVEDNFLATCHTITGPSYFDIETPTKSELIASNHDVAGIRDHLGVDSLGYLSLDGMLRAAGGDPADFCHACFSGAYPTQIPEDDLAGARHAAPLLTTAV